MSLSREVKQSLDGAETLSRINKLWRKGDIASQLRRGGAAALSGVLVPESHLTDINPALLKLTIHRIVKKMSILRVKYSLGHKCP